MARRKSRILTEVELEFMQEIWFVEEITSDDVRNALIKKGRILTDGTVRKVLLIMLKKGYIDRRRDGRTYHYKAKVLRDQARGSMLHDLLTRAFGGSASCMVAALLDIHNIRKGEIEEIKQLIAEHEKVV